MASGDAEKTEKPTGKKIKEARKEGQIAKSAEFATWIQVFVATIAIEWTISKGTSGGDRLMQDIRTVALEPEPGTALKTLSSGFELVFVSVLPLALVMVFIGVATGYVQVGAVLATKAVKPKFSKLNPLAGLKRMFKPQGLWNAGKSALKVLLLAAIAWGPVTTISATLLEAGQPPINTVVATVVKVGIGMVRSIALVGLVLGCVDYGVQKWQTTKSLKMSKKEIRDEHKSADGDPLLKSQIRRRMHEVSSNRMISSVADASVVVVNPTHVAVALKYGPGNPAPVVVAKGKGVLADRIRAEAEKHYVPIVRDVVLARTLEKTVKVEQTIPPDMFEAVALLLAFVITVGKKASLLGGVLPNPHAQPIPSDWELEPELASALN